MTGLETSTEGERHFDLSETEWITIGGGKGAAAGASENCYKTKAQASAKAADVWCAGRSYWANFIIEQ